MAAVYCASCGGMVRFALVSDLPTPQAYAALITVAPGDSEHDLVIEAQNRGRARVKRDVVVKVTTCRYRR